MTDWSGPVLALTVKQPWAWAIIHAGKDVENRTWATNHRGPLLIHAGKSYDRDGRQQLRAMGIDVPRRLPTGGIVGQVELVGCVRDSRSSWATPGRYHWKLASPRALEYRELKGQQGLFNVGGRAQQSLDVDL